MVSVLGRQRALGNVMYKWKDNIEVDVYMTLGYA
jgi:hypothetical protein